MASDKSRPDVVPLLISDSLSSLTLKEAAGIAGCTRQTAIIWAVRAGIAHQPHGFYGRWRVHHAGWLALLAGDDQALADMREGRETSRVAGYVEKAKASGRSGGSARPALQAEGAAA